jgi:hypothetical protein
VGMSTRSGWPTTLALMVRIVLKPQPTGDGRIVLRAETETLRVRVRRLAAALRPRRTAPATR